MADRCTLHLSKLDEFAAWCSGEGWVKEDHSRNEFAVLRLRRGKEVVVFYARNYAREHASVPDGVGSALIDRWLKKRDNTALSKPEAAK